MAEQSTEYVSGLFAKAKHQNAPAFVVCKLSAKPKELIAWLETKLDQEWVNMDVKIARDGQKLYVQVDNWKKSEYQEPDRSNFDREDDTVEVENDDGSVDIDYPADDLNPNDIPF